LDVATTGGEAGDVGAAGSVPISGAGAWSHQRAALAGLAAAVLLALGLIATSPSIAIVWDEGYTLGREERVRQWFAAMRDPSGFAARWSPPTPLERLLQPDQERVPRRDEIDTRSKLIRPPAVRWFWPFARAEPHGHPPFYAMVGMLGDVLAPASWTPLDRARLGPILLFSLAGGAVVAFFARRYGGWPALATLAGWALSPRLFAHAHYAHYDVVLTSLWVLAVLAFWKAVEPGPSSRLRPAWIVALGACVGLAMATKLTGWFIPLPLLAWAAVWGRNRRVGLTLALGGLVAVAVLWAAVPTWWTSPIAGVEAFLRSNLGRARSTHIPTLFLGHTYITPQESLPPYNTVVLTLMTTPVFLLLLGAGGLVAAVRHRAVDGLGPLVALSWLFVMALRSLPGAPGHDGVRQFLPAFGFAALLAGLGAAEAIRRRPRIGPWLVGAAVAEGLVSVAVMMPVPDSYYSPLVGGLPGATALGMEPTYYWDALTPDARRWLAQHTPPGRSVLFANNPTSWLDLRQTGALAVPVAGLEPDAGPPAFYVVQNRPGMWSRLDRRLIAAHGASSAIVTRLGVPLLWAFPFEAYEQERQRERTMGAGP
jgi:4-amino-4-deoxy-L-arabinose transferase-like glycosyltransferase